MRCEKIDILDLEFCSEKFKARKIVDDTKILKIYNAKNNEIIEFDKEYVISYQIHKKDEKTFIVDIRFAKEE